MDTIVNWAPWAQVIQTAIAVIGVPIVIYQLRELQKSVRSAARWSIYDVAARVKETIIDDPELMPYFYEGRDITPGDESYEKAMAVADLFCLYVEQLATQGEAVSRKNREAWKRYARDVYRHSPAVQMHLKGKEGWYSGEFWAFIDSKPPN